VRDKFLYIMILILVAIAFFEGGYILRNRQIDRTEAEVQKLNRWVLDHGGRLESIEIIDRKEKTGSGKPVNPDANTP
jgi:hypothetical protein